jgi:hypothetical protein
MKSEDGEVRVVAMAWKGDGSQILASRQEQQDQTPMGEGAGRDMTRFEGVFELLYFVFQSTVRAVLLPEVREG